MVGKRYADLCSDPWALEVENYKALVVHQCLSPLLMRVYATVFYIHWILQKGWRVISWMDQWLLFIFL